jgi:uncharacterized membrane protein YhhN
MNARKHRWLVVSIALGAAFWLFGDRVAWWPLHMAFKGAPVAVLAWYALEQSTSVTRPIGVVMAFGALGDVLIEIDLAFGALAFLCGHFFACWFYIQNRRALKWTDALAAAVIATTIPALASVVMPGETSVLAYACGLGAMAGCAWCSRFRRDRVALGALLFAVSDIVLFARMGVLAGSALANTLHAVDLRTLQAVAGRLVWPLYFGGQVLIAYGVINRAQLLLSGSSNSRASGRRAKAAVIGSAP